MANGTSLHINIAGDKEVAKMLESVALEANDLKPAMQDIGKYLKSFFAGEVFSSRGSVIGHPWMRLSDDYAARKASGKKRPPDKGKGAYPGRPLLVRTGTMQRSFHYKSSPVQVEISNSAKHFVYHQSSDERTIMPYRPMMDVQTNDARYQKIVQIMTAHLAKAIKDKEVA